MLFRSKTIHKNARKSLTWVTIGFLCLVAPAHGLDDESMSKALASWEAGKYQEALEIWLLKAYEGDAEAQYRLGLMFADGTGTVVDHSEAVYWFTRATEQGHAEAQFELGNAYFHGSGTSPDKAKAIEWWQVAAENGSARAQYHLGRAYFYGIDMDQDAVRAMDWFEKAAANDYQLAREFLERVGASQDADSAETATDAEAWKGYGRVGERPIWVYSSFNRLSPILKKLPGGSLLRVVESTKGWFRVQMPGGVPVWIPADKVVRDGEVHRISGAGVQARPDPSNDPDVKSVGIFLDGDEVRLLETKDQWAQVQAPESVTGWVEAIDVHELSEDSQVAGEWQAARAETLGALPVTGSVAAAESASEQVVEAVAEESVAQDSQADDAAQVEAQEQPAAAEPAATAADAGEAEVVEAEKEQEVMEPASESADLPLDVRDDDPRFATAVEPAGIRVGDLLRIGPGGVDAFARNRLDSALIEKLPPALLIRVTNRAKGWLRVEVPGGLPLWIYSRFLDRDGELGRITGRGVRARPLPSTSNASQPVGTYPTGAVVKVIEETGKWVRIRAPESLSGWIQAQNLFEIPGDSSDVEAEWMAQTESGPAPTSIIVGEEVAVSSADESDESTGSPDQPGEAGEPEAEIEADAVDDAVEIAASGESLAVGKDADVQPLTAETGQDPVQVPETGTGETDMAQTEIDDTAEPADSPEAVDSTTPTAEEPTGDDAEVATVSDTDTPEMEIATATVAATESHETTEAETAEAETAEAETAEAETAEAETTEAETTEAETAEAETTEAETAEAETADSSTEADESESGSGETTQVAELDQTEPPQSLAQAETEQPAATDADTGQADAAVETDESAAASGNQAESQAVVDEADAAPEATEITARADAAPEASQDEIAADGTGADGTTGTGGVLSSGKDSVDNTLVTSVDEDETVIPEVSPDETDDGPATVEAEVAVVDEAPVTDSPITDSKDEVDDTRLAGESEPAVVDESVTAQAEAVLANDAVVPESDVVAAHEETPAANQVESAPGEGGEATTADATKTPEAVSESATVDESPVDESQPDVVTTESAAGNDAAMVEKSDTPPAPLESTEDAGDVTAVGGAAGEQAAEPPVAEQPLETGGEQAPSTEAAVESQAQAEPVTTPVPDETPGTGLVFDDLNWLYKQSSEAFSIELLREAKKSSVLEAAEKIETGHPVVSYSTLTGSGLVYNLMVGAFDDLLGVQAELQNVQTEFDSIRIRRLGAVQTEWCKKVDNLTPEQLMVLVGKCAGE